MSPTTAPPPPRPSRSPDGLSTGRRPGTAIGADPWIPFSARVLRRADEAEAIFTLDLEFLDPELRADYAFRPGQFNMLLAPGMGECAISIASPTDRPRLLSHTIHAVGQVTGALSRLAVGDTVGVRGPFGSSWPLDRARGRNLTFVAGGIGLPPLRPAILEVLRDRDAYDRVTLVYGARTPAGLLFTDEFPKWRDGGIEVLLTADSADPSWRGYRGVVPGVLEKLRLRGPGNVLMMCGPEIMMRFAAEGALHREVPADQVFVTMERNMSCAIAQCGHCQLGPDFLCKDGPVLPYSRVRRFLLREGF